MKHIDEKISLLHDELSKTIRKEGCAEEAIALFLEIHAQLNPSEIYGTQSNQVDELLGDLSRHEYAIMPTSKDETIAWVLWHNARIEDITMNMLVAQKDQIFNAEWQEKMNSPITDTGNALSDDEIMKLSREIDIEELRRYRGEVARSTREIVKGLQTEDMCRKLESSDLARILASGGLTQQEESICLFGYWEKEDVAGMLLMPPTRHVILHLNDCFKWKDHFRSGK